MIIRMSRTLALFVRNFRFCRCWGAGVDHQQRRVGARPIDVGHARKALPPPALRIPGRHIEFPQLFARVFPQLSQCDQRGVRLPHPVPVLVIPNHSGTCLPRQAGGDCRVKPRKRPAGIHRRELIYSLLRQPIGKRSILLHSHNGGIAHTSLGVAGCGGIGAGAGNTNGGGAGTGSGSAMDGAEGLELFPGAALWAN